VSIRIAHISDTHIRNYKYHFEYKAAFQDLYSKLREQKVDYIIHCGDIAHTKTQLSPEYFELASDFLSNLANIAPTYVILGNHDGNLKNSNRQDAITPIVQALMHSNLHLLKNSGEVVVNDLLTLNVLSVFDEDKWVKPSDQSKINIALYHGAIGGVQTDIGWTMQGGDHDLSIFSDHDYALLGDIHKTNQVLDTEGKVRYPGSTIQQNFGETNDKGYLLWDIRSKDDFDCTHIQIHNPRPFVTVNLTSKGQLPKNVVVPSGARVRLASEFNLTVQQMNRAVELAKHKFSPESVTFLSRADNKRGLGSNAITNVPKENLRDPAILEKFIRDYLKDYECTEEVIQKVLELNKKYSAIVEETEEVGRNINWQIKSLEWSNLFNYGENNKINFENLSGIVGIFGKNFSGKSSIVDSLLFTIFNTTSKNERKNFNVINQQKNFASCVATIAINTDIYTIERSLTKYKKKAKSEVFDEAKAELDFVKECTVTNTKESMNGVSRVETDHNIRRIFGTFDDFLNTSMSSQLDGLSFVREGSTKRKEIIAKFLDLEIFEKKFRLAKDDSSDLKGALRRLEGRNFDGEIDNAHVELTNSEQELSDCLEKCKILEARVQELENEIKTLEEQVNACSTEVIDGAELRNLISKTNLNVLTTEGQVIENEKSLAEKKTLLEKITAFIANYDYQSLVVRKENVKLLREQMSEMEREVKLASSKASLLEGIPCGTQFPKCKFIRDASGSSTIVTETKDKIQQLTDKLSEYKPDSIQADLDKYNSIIARREELVKEIKDLDFYIERGNFNLTKLQDELGSLRQKEEVYEQTKEQIKNAQSLMINLNKLKVSLKDAKRSHTDCTDKLVLIHRRIGSAEQKLEMLTTQKDELAELRTEFSAYELFMRCMHSNGIAYDIIKKQLPVVNDEITKILSNLTEFNVFFEEEGDKLDIMIKHVDQDPRPLSMASGAEKTMAAMAIRLALLQVSNLPKSDIMILDEPGTALDENHLQTFTQLLDLLKTQFRTILVISHLDSLKDVVDTTIEIASKDGFAFVNQ
jgi:DNA repair exonuclease SbcCD ATPase subunit/predicted phosphodiesterase